MLKRVPKIADAIFFGDLHLRSTDPICRTDNFSEETQWRKLKWLCDLQKKHNNCPVYHSGDLFHKWNPSPYLITKALLHLPINLFTIYGNHDLPQHSIKLEEQCGIYTLATAKRLTILKQGHWGETKFKVKNCVEIKGRKILLWHVMTYQGKRPYPGCTFPRSAALLNKHKEYDVILTGHNHKPILEKMDGRILLNPGSFTRQATDELHAPSVYLYYADTNKVVRMVIPHDADAVNAEHITEAEDRSERIAAFVETVAKHDVKLDLRFEDNVYAYMLDNKTKPRVQKIIKESFL